MTTLVRHDEDSSRRASPTGTWQRWAAAIIATWTAALQPHDDVRPRLLQHFRLAARPALLAAALHYLDAINTTDARSYPHGIYQQLMPDLRPTLVDRLRADRYRADLSKDLLDLIIDVSTPEDARGLVHDLCNSAREPTASLALERLAALDPIAAVDRLNGAPAHGRTPHTRHCGASTSAHSTTSRLATAATLLLDTYPYADDPPDLRGFANSPHREMRELTGGAPPASSPTAGDIEALERLLCRPPRPRPASHRPLPPREPDGDAPN